MRQRLNAIGPSQKRQLYTFILEKYNEIVYSMCTMQCGRMEAKALSFDLHTVGGEHHQKSSRQVFMYVGGGWMGMNDTCYFSFNM